MIMGGAVIIAIAVGMIVHMKVAPKAAKEQKAVNGVEVLVAAKSLSAGEVLRADATHWESWPEGISFNGMIKKKDQVDEKKVEAFGKPLRRDIQQGEPITTQAVVMDASAGGFLAAGIEPGMRAVGVSVKAETMAGGFIGPGDHVDVILTYQLNLKGDAENYSSETVQRFASETILSNLRVLAVDQNAREAGREAKVGRTVTLEASKEGAQVLAMASTMGEITLSLRRLGEKDTAADAEPPLTTDVTSSRVIRRIYEIMEQSKTATGSVRLYNGSSVINLPVRAPSPEKQEAP